MTTDDRRRVIVPDEIGIGALKELVLMHHEDAEAGHGRLRTDLREVESRIRTVEKHINDHCKELAEVMQWRKQPTEAASIRFTPAMVFAMLALCASVVGGQKWSTAGMAEQMASQASDIRIINAKMDAIKQHAEDVTALENERAAQVAREMTRIGAQATMIDTKINNLMANRR